MSWIVAHFLAKMHQKMIQFHILDSFYDNMSFLTFKVESLSQKTLKISSKKIWTQMGPEIFIPFLRRVYVLGVAKSARHRKRTYFLRYEQMCSAGTS